MNKRVFKNVVCLLTVWVFLLNQFAYAGLYEDLLGLPSSKDMPRSGPTGQVPKLPPDAVFVPQNGQVLYYTTIRSNSYLAIYDIRTRQTSYQGLGSYGFGGIKAIRPDGSYAIVASTVNTIYVVPIKDLSQKTQMFFMPVPEGEWVTEYSLDKARFINPTTVLLRLQNGNRYTLNIFTGQIKELSR